ncbi:unnamed protein product, partial [Amoebophrya sp. A25]
RTSQGQSKEVSRRVIEFDSAHRIAEEGIGVTKYGQTPTTTEREASDKKEEHAIDPRMCRLWVSPLDRARWLVLKRMRQEWKQSRASTGQMGSRKLSVAQFLQGLIVLGGGSKKESSGGFSGDGAAFTLDTQTAETVRKLLQPQEGAEESPWVSAMRDAVEQAAASPASTLDATPALRPSLAALVLTQLHREIYDAYEATALPPPEKGGLESAAVRLLMSGEK